MEASSRLGRAGGDPAPAARPGRRGRMVVLGILLFAVAFAAGGYFAVKWITATRLAQRRESAPAPAAAPDSPEAGPAVR